MIDSDTRAAVKALFAIPAMVLGGSQRVYLTLLRRLNRARIEPHLVVLEATGFHLPEVPRDIPIHDLHVKRARNAVWPLVRLCRELQPRAVISTSAHLNAAVILARSFMPLDTTVITREGADITAPERHVSRVRLAIYKSLYRRADVVVCQSQYLKETLARDFAISPLKLACIYNPVDIESLVAAARSGPSPFPNTGCHLVYAGRLAQEKGVDLLLRCMHRVRNAVPNVTLTVLGDGPEAVHLRALRRTLELESYVRFLGEVRNPYPFLDRAACVVLPSRTEALPNVVLEALALGTPVVASNCSGTLEEIRATTRFLKVCDDRTPEGLADGIIDWLHRHRNSEQTVEPAFIARFGVDAVIEQYENLILQTVHPRPKETTVRIQPQSAEHPFTTVGLESAPTRSTTAAGHSRIRSHG